jgi:coenzyme F420-reducing hydrogenase alpha subunit
MSYRLPAVIVLFGASMLLFASAERALPAAGDKTTEANLKNEVSQLQTQVKQLQTASTQAQTTQKTLQSTIDGYRGAGLIHIVILKAKTDAATADTTESKTKSDDKDKKDPQQKFLDDAYSQLAKIKGVRGFWAGKPSTKSSASDSNSDYTVAVVSVFDDATGLKTYLNDTAHTKFTDKYYKNYDTPIVFNIEPRKPQP